MHKNAQHKEVKTERTSQGLRDALFDTLDGVLAGKVPARDAAAIAGIASQIVAVSKLEFVHHRFVSSVTEQEIARGPAPIRLGS